MTDPAFEHSQLPDGDAFLGELASGQRIMLTLDNDDEILITLSEREVRIFLADCAGEVAAELRFSRPFNDNNYDD
jgi:antitoxin component of MazEF toxin-antitoxin module